MRVCMCVGVCVIRITKIEGLLKSDYIFNSHFTWLKSNWICNPRYKLMTWSCIAVHKDRSLKPGTIPLKSMGLCGGTENCLYLKQWWVGVQNWATVKQRWPYSFTAIIYLLLLLSISILISHGTSFLLEKFCKIWITPCSKWWGCKSKT